MRFIEGRRCLRRASSSANVSSVMRSKVSRQEERRELCAVSVDHRQFPTLKRCFVAGYFEWLTSASLSDAQKQGSTCLNARMHPRPPRSIEPSKWLRVVGLVSAAAALATACVYDPDDRCGVDRHFT